MDARFPIVGVGACAGGGEAPGELSTGIRTRYTPGFDIDIRDADVADQVQQALLNLLPQGTLLKRVGLAPRRSLRARGRRRRSIRG
jgi:hypothetical protein